MAQLSEKIAPLSVLVGTWDTTLVPSLPDGGDGPESPATDIYEFSPNGQFLYHYVDATMDGERVQSFEVASAGEGAGQYATHSFDADGSVNGFKAVLDGDNWRLTGDSQRFAGQFSADGSVLTGRWEQRDGARWLPLMKVTLRRRG